VRIIRRRVFYRTNQANDGIFTLSFLLNLRVAGVNVVRSALSFTTPEAIGPDVSQGRHGLTARTKGAVMSGHALAGVLSSVVILAAGAVLSAQVTAGPAGHWEGTIQVPGQELIVVIDLSGTGDTWEGAIGIPAQGLKAFPLAEILVNESSVSFAMKGVPGEPRFRGTLSPDAKALSGEFSQGGASLPFALTRTGPAVIEQVPASTAVTKDLEGSWEGGVDVDGTALRLVVTLTNHEGGPATAVLVSVDQGGATIPVTAVVQKDAHLTLQVRPVSGDYEGDLADGKLTGTWTQGPRSFPLVLQRK
jgi:hypothetical protein